MSLLIQKLFDTTGYLPLGECFSWQESVLVTNVGGDLLIALVYFAAPFILYTLTQRRAFYINKYILTVFSIFIWICALRHVLNIVTIWEPVYYLQGVFKLITGLLAVITLVVFYRSYPKALGLDKANALAQANDRLKEEVAERERAQVALRQANEALETRVQQRTSQLIKTNRELEKEIEQRKKTEQDLLDKNAELTRINAELDNFVYHASHDLKDPIVKIEGLVTALKEEIPQTNPNVNAIFQHLDGSLLKVDQTVLDLTEVGRIQKRHETEKLEEVQFETICAEVRAELESKLKQANAVVSTNFKAKTVQFSPKKLKKIFGNLLSNCLQMQEPGRPLKIEITTELVSDHVLLCIADNGKGFSLPEENKQQQAPEIKAGNWDGLGLSYYIVKRLINNCNGKIAVKSAPGQGSTFEILLPLQVYQKS